MKAPEAGAGRRGIGRRAETPIEAVGAAITTGLSGIR